MNYTSHYIEVNNIKMHYIDYAHEATTIVCLHGLTANAHAFDGLIAQGLNNNYRIVAPDMRGRGLSDRPAFCYTMEDHALDIIGLLDHLKIESAILMGHSFGGLLSMYLAKNYPDRIEQITILDAAAEMNPNTLEMLGASLSRLDAKFPSWHDYLQTIKAAPFNNPWDDTMLSYYKADVMPTEEGGVTPRPNLTDIIEVSTGVAAIDWKELIPEIKQAAILINGQDAYTMGEPLLPDYKAKETVAMMPDCTYVAVDGNHHTMMYGDAGSQVVKAVESFVK